MDKNIEEICPFPHRRRGMFYFENDTFYLEKRGTFGIPISLLRFASLPLRARVPNLLHRPVYINYKTFNFYLLL